MSNGFNLGDEVYAGYPDAHVFNFRRNSKKALKLSKVKHLLWGDWIKVTDYDYQTDPQADIQTAAEQTLVQNTTAPMVAVRVRGVSGYMHKADIQKERLLEIVFVDVGQGDGALLVTPDDKKYVIDAGVSDNMRRYLAWRFAGFKKLLKDFDGLIITHPDQDHYRGFQALIDNLDVQVDHIWHNGIVEQFKVTASGSQSSVASFLLGPRKTSAGQSFLTGLIEDDAALAAHLADPNRWIKKSTGRPKQYPDLLNSAQTAKSANGKRRFSNIAMLSTAHGEMHNGKAYLPGFGPNNAPACVIEVLGPVVEPDNQGAPRLRTFDDEPQAKTTAMDSGKTKNGHSILLKLTYKNTTVLFGGDLNSPAEMFLLQHYTGLSVYQPGAVSDQDTIQAGRPVFGADIAKSCHHGSADFTDVFLACVNPAATVISSGDEESHAHPRSDTLGAIGHHGRGHRSLILSTELMRSSKEFSKREDSPWYKAGRLTAQAEAETDPVKKSALKASAEKLMEVLKTRNVTSYGAINFRSDGEKVVMAYMLEKDSASRRWDIYQLESTNNGPLHYKPKD